MNTMTLSREIEAAKLLREQIAVLADGDEDFIRDTLEGETSIREIIGSLVANEAEDKSLIEGMDLLMQKIAGRKERVARRVELRRSLIATGMDVAGITKLETASGTVFTKSVPPSLILKEEADIPARFWKAAAPKLDRKELIAALKAKEIIPGAELGNGGQTIQIRS